MTNGVSKTHVTPKKRKLGMVCPIDLPPAYGLRSESYDGCQINAVKLLSGKTSTTFDFRVLDMTWGSDSADPHTVKTDEYLLTDTVHCIRAQVIRS